MFQRLLAYQHSGRCMCRQMQSGWAAAGWDKATRESLHIHACMPRICTSEPQPLPGPAAVQAFATHSLLAGAASLLALLGQGINDALDAGIAHGRSSVHVQAARRRV